MQCRAGRLFAPCSTSDLVPLAPSARKQGEQKHTSEGGMLRLETLVEIKSLNSRFSSFNTFNQHLFDTFNNFKIALNKRFPLRQPWAPLATCACPKARRADQCAMVWMFCGLDAMDSLRIICCII